MLNRTTVLGFAVALAAALVVAVLVTPAIGPRASRAEFGTTALSIKEMHRQVDHSNLPIDPIPLP